jgi:hypothetical protein
MTALLIILTAVEIVLVLVVLVVYLVKITASLKRTAAYLAKVSFGVRAIETQCEPIGPSVLQINAQLERIAEGLGAAAQLAGDGRRG